MMAVLLCTATGGVEAAQVSGETYELNPLVVTASRYAKEELEIPAST